MANSQILECTNCLQQFCLTCDSDFTKCPDCKGPMCEDCSTSALDERQSRCFCCHDPELSVTTFPYSRYDRKLYKNYTTPVKGCLDSD